MKRLIVNADDFGLAPGVNQAVVELQQAGALSSATLMSTGAYFAPAVYLALEQRLAVGCHIVLVDGSPILGPDQAPSLLAQPRGSLSLRPTVTDFLADLFRGRIRQEEIEAEAIAQIQHIQASGLSVSHIDSHKHLHAFPRVLAPLLRAAKQCGIACVRNPFEPLWSIRATATASPWRRAQVHAMRTRQRAFKKLTQEHGMMTAEGAVGVLATGSLDARVLASLIDAMPDGTWELVCHPGYLDRSLEQVRTRLRAARDVERRALLEVIPRAVRDRPDITLINFHQLAQMGE